MKDGPELCIDQKLSSTIRHKIIFFYTIPLRHRGTAWLPDLTKTSAKLGRIRGQGVPVKGHASVHFYLAGPR